MTEIKKAIISIIVISSFLLFPVIGFTQSPPHPNGGGTPGSGNTPVGGGAPVGGGLIIMMALGLGYGLRKISGYSKKD